MRSYIGHIVLKVDIQHLVFYKSFFQFMGWSLYFENKDKLAVMDGNGTRVWFEKPSKEASNDYDGVGMNHLAIQVDSQADVDAAAEFLKTEKIDLLYETPKHRPDFCAEPGHTYYQVMFETPDELLFEVVYKGPKT